MHIIIIIIIMIEKMLKKMLVCSRQFLGVSLKLPVSVEWEKMLANWVFLLFEVDEIWDPIVIGNERGCGLKWEE